MPDVSSLITGSIVLTLVIIVASFALTFGLIFYFNRSNRKKAEALMATGRQGTATVLGLQDTGMRINDNPRISVLLEVNIPGYPVYQVQKSMVIPMIKISQVQVGSTVGVMADPTQPANPDKLGLLLA
ncbi:MAG: hypothetical protein AB1894_16920 [Chloroflexota bacterium]